VLSPDQVRAQRLREEDVGQLGKDCLRAGRRVISLLPCQREHRLDPVTDPGARRLEAQYLGQSGGQHRRFIQAVEHEVELGHVRPVDAESPRRPELGQAVDAAANADSR
jgi:hypothetical protein